MPTWVLFINILKDHYLKQPFNLNSYQKTQITIACKLWTLSFAPQFSSTAIEIGL
jgi:hypothetical protein